MAAVTASNVPRHDVPRNGRSGFVLVDGRQVHYLEWGPATGPAVLCLHGGGQTAYMWEELGSSLRDRYRVLAPDLPAHGDSDPVEGMSREVIADTMPALLAEFGLDRVALVGASSSCPSTSRSRRSTRPPPRSRSTCRSAGPSARRA